MGVLAVACLGPVAPADANTAATLTFQVAANGTVTQTNTQQPSDSTVENLRRAACDSETYTSAAAPSPSPSPTS